MTQLIGVTGFPYMGQTSLKQAAIIFDQIRVFDMGDEFRTLQNDSLRSDMQWLSKKGICQLVPSMTLQPRELRPTEDKAVIERAMPYNILVQAQAKLFLESYAKGDYKRASLGIAQYIDWFIDNWSSIVGEVRWPPQPVAIDMQIFNGLFLVSQTICEQLALWDSMLTAPDSDSKKVFFSNSQFARNVLLEVKKRNISRNDQTSELISIIMHSLPEPDDLTPWEAIIEFREDPDTKAKYTRLRHWIQALVRKGLTAKDAAEELEYLQFEYEEHIKLHKMKTKYNTLEILVVTPLEIIEDLIRGKFSTLGKRILSVKKKRIALLDAEFQAPGREIAYIYKARNFFNDKTN